MIVSMNWIKEFVDLRGLDELELIQRFTLSTAEVEQVIPKGRDVTGVVAGKILRVEKHPDSKKLHLLQVSAGAGGIYDVVCGAPNVREGLVVPFAPLGARLGELEITAAKIAGFVSHGMCCSEKELGISEDHSGLMELPADAPLGADIKTLFGLEDIVFEVDNKSLTNRPDLWGHYGIAREFAVLAGRELKPFAQAGCSKYEALEPIEIQIETEDCLRYSGIKIRHITKTLSPVDMRIRLFYCGMRSINLLADLTNYVMLELSQPMHAFDIRKADRIEVRKFDEPFVFSTLDGTERSIDPAAMMICANGRPLAVAGVMGGLDSEIVEDTDGLLLESANFDPVSIRKTSTRLGLRTDASMRYEKTLDPELTIAGIRRFLKLLMDIDPGVEVISSLSDNYARRYPEIAFSFSKAYVDRCTGIDIPRGTILKTLAGLGFAPRLEEDEFHITVPSWRATKDISIKADMIEEITRVYGYDNFELKSAGVVLAPVRASEQKSCGNAVKDILVRRCHLHEVHSYLWHDAEKCKKLGLAIEENVKIVNSVDSVNSTLRGSMIPTLLCALYDNQGFGASYGLFEIGSVAEGLTADGLCNERRKLGIALYSREATERALFYRLKEALVYIADSLKHKPLEFSALEAPAHDWLHPVNSAAVSLDGQALGLISVLHPRVRGQLDLVNRKAPIEKKAAVAVAELDMDAFAEIPAANFRYAAPSSYPSVAIDLSLVLNEEDTYGKIEGILQSVGCETLQSAALADYYEAGGETSLAIRLTFVSGGRSLLMDEVQEDVARIVEALGKAGIARKGV